MLPQFLPTLLASTLLLIAASCQQIKGNIRLFATNNQCDTSDGFWQCGDADPGVCCSISATQFILSTNTQIISSPSGGTTTHILGGAQGGNRCAVTLNSDPSCARTSQADTAQGGSYSWKPFQAVGRRSVVEARGGEELCSTPDTFHISEGGTTYVAPVDDSTITYVLSLGKEDKLAWAKENGKAL